MIAIVDYGLGNIRAFVNLYERLNIPISVARTPHDLEPATKIILPGVGAFDYAMNRLNGSGMRDMLDRLVLNQGVPVLGICVGMQMMAKSSEEGVLAGLGWVDGVVRKFKAEDSVSRLVLPHMGWNTIVPNGINQLLADLDDDSRFYFLHSYYFDCACESDVIATTDYGIRYSSALNQNNVFGVQFHPEKSHQWGIRLLTNFARL